MATITTLEITLGEETLSPHRFEGFRVGPITVMITLDPGEDVLEATKRIKEALTPVWDEMFLFQRNKYHEHHSLKE